MLAADDKRFAVWRESHGATRFADEYLHILCALRIPKLYHKAGARQRAPRRIVSEGGNLIVVSAERAQLGLCGNVPNSDDLVQASGRERPAVGRECHAEDLPIRRRKIPRVPSFVTHTPHSQKALLDDLVTPAANKMSPIRGKRDGENRHVDLLSKASFPSRGLPQCQLSSGSASEQSRAIGRKGSREIAAASRYRDRPVCPARLQIP